MFVWCALCDRQPAYVPDEAPDEILALCVACLGVFLPQAPQGGDDDA